MKFSFDEKKSYYWIFFQMSLQNFEEASVHVSFTEIE